MMMFQQPTVLDSLRDTHSPSAFNELSRRTGMAMTKQKLRPWLEGQLNRGEVEGVEWIDKEQMIFKLPWKHGGKSDWNPLDSELFKAWAKNTGKYREGQDKEEYATWKTRVRCALNKASDIKELKDRHGIDEPKPYKVYQFLPKKESQRNDVPNIGLTDEETSRFIEDFMTEDDSFLTGGDVPVVIRDFSALPSHAQQPFGQMTFSDRQPHEGCDFMGISVFEDVTMSGNDDERLPSDLRSLPSGDLIQKSLDLAQYESMTVEEMEIEIAPAPAPMPSYDQIQTDPLSFPTDPMTGEPKFSSPPVSYRFQQTDVLVETNTGPIQVSSNAQIKVVDATGTTLTCSASDIGKFMSHLKPPISIIEVSARVGSNQSQLTSVIQPAEVQEEPRKESIRHDHAYGASNLAAPLVNLDMYMFRGFEMRVTLYYFGNVLFERDLLHPQGYCFHFGCDSKIQKNISDKHLAAAIMGPDNMHRCPLPNVPQSFGDLQKQNVQTALDGLERGFTVYCDNGNIYITRYCKTRLFMATSEHRIIEQTLPRQMTKEAFNYQRYNYKLFNESFTKPDPAVYLGLAQKWNFGKRNDQLAVTMKLACSKALQIYSRTYKIDETLFLTEQDNSAPMPLEISKSNSIDRLAQQLKEQNIRISQS